MATHSNILAWRNPMDRGAQQGTVHGVAKESDITVTKQQQIIEAPLKLPFIGQAIEAGEVKKLVQS